jgi:Heterokaryon incompatibility protein Het-C
VDPRELEVDPRTGIKNYIANEDGGWTTSTAYIRNSLLKAIELGRRGHHNEKDMHEALRLLGQVPLPTIRRN